jgi:hypothetical protein
MLENSTDSTACLDPLETNVQNPTAPPREPHQPTLTYAQTFRHSGWKPIRLAVLAAMQAASVGANRIARFMACGSQVHLAYDPAQPDHAVVRGTYCHDRFCLPCAAARAFHVSRTVTEIIGHRRCRMLTLTLRSQPGPLRPQLARLQNCFRKLRRTRLWNKAVKGSVAFLELTHNHDTETWHPHLHILALGTYIAKQPLADLWHEITGDSFIVHLTLCNDATDVCRYVTKYVTKPLTFVGFRRSDLLAEALLAMGGTRLCTTTGCLRGLALNRRPADKTYKFLATLEQLRDLALTGMRDAQAALDQLKGHATCTLTPNLLDALSRDAPATASSFSYQGNPIAPCVQLPLHPLWRRPSTA